MLTTPAAIHSVKRDPTNLAVSFVTDIEFDQFEHFANSFCQHIDCRIIQRHWGADRHQWQLEFEGCLLTLNYEFYANVCWLNVEHDHDWETLEYLTTLIQRISNHTPAGRSDCAT